jgi:hypothetical protein
MWQQLKLTSSSLHALPLPVSGVLLLFVTPFSCRCMASFIGAYPC